MRAGPADATTYNASLMPILAAPTGSLRLSVAPMMERTETYLESIACEGACAGFVHTP